MEADEARKRLFAQRLQGKKEKDEIRTTIQPRPQEKPLRLAPSQLRIWTLQETEPKSPLFNIVNSHWYTGTLDLIALEEAVKRVIERHPILFATFSPEEEGIMIIPGRATDFNLENYTLTKEEALTKAKKESHRFFNLRKEKPLRLLVYQTSDSERSLLQLITHHLVFDEWSLGLFWKEISLFYAGETSTAPHLAINYYDYAHWQSEHIQSPIYQSQLEAWTHRLKDPPPPLELPGDLAEEPSISSKGKKCKLSLNPELCGALRKLTNTQGTSLSNCLLAAYKVFLFHLTQESNFAVGSPIANRKYAELSPLIGFFLSTVALRTTLQGDLPFQDFLARVHDTMQHALKNQDVLFDDLVRALNPVRQSGRHPLFSTMFVFEGELESRPQIELSNHEFELISLHPNVAKVDLCLFAIEQKESLDLLFEYRSDKFSSELIEGWLHNFVSLLEAITRNPQQSLVRLNLLTKSEQNDLQPPPPLSSVPTSVLEPISQIVKTHPQKLALSGDKALTYLELWEQSGRLAAEIQRSGIHKGVIALLITREINAIIAILGILRSGNAYLPLDPVTPPERLANLLELASAEAVVSQGQPPKNLSETLPYFDLTQRFEEEILPESPRPENLAYLIFTSGSTGTPKAVPITHRNLTHSTQARLEYYSSPPKRFLLLSPLHFDSSVAGIFWTLTAGGTLLPLPSGMEHDPTKLVDFVQKHKITHSLGLPSLIQIILESSDPDNLVSLRTLIAAGESCSTTLAQLHHKKIPEGKLFNEYGPTEATVWATVHEVSPDENPIPIGQSIPGLKAFSLNAAGLPTPTGMIGELALAGPTLSPGYLEQLDLTKKKFITLDIQSLSLIHI